MTKSSFLYRLLELGNFGVQYLHKTICHSISIRQRQDAELFLSAHKSKLFENNPPLAQNVEKSKLIVQYR